MKIYKENAHWCHHCDCESNYCLDFNAEGTVGAVENTRIYLCSGCLEMFKNILTKRKSI